MCFRLHGSEMDLLPHVVIFGTTGSHLHRGCALNTKISKILVFFFFFRFVYTGSYTIREVTLRVQLVGSNDFVRDPKREFASGFGRQEKDGVWQNRSHSIKVN